MEADPMSRTGSNDARGRALTGEKQSEGHQRMIASVALLHMDQSLAGQRYLDANAVWIEHERNPPVFNACLSRIPNDIRRRGFVQLGWIQRGRPVPAPMLQPDHG